MGKILSIIMTLLLLEATSHKMRFVVLKRSIGASLNLVDPLVSDGVLRCDHKYLPEPLWCIQNLPEPLWCNRKY
jgi:hypothetical protein